ncbi:hypothetical protein OIU84_024889 [Salix udensis]|uniref:Sieve element occlusion N-terminal domain-containing protein n=1 Tax=Salix udensis TaxID=889485 RepID=A0AAD6PD05_9ROSI|nr:hypothetical protein OIU84_024889 [Salix udensis]
MASGLPLRHPAQGFNASQQLIKSDRGNMLAMSHDNVMMKQIVGTHAPNGIEVDVKPLLHLVKEILTRATTQINISQTTSQAQAELEETTYPDSFFKMLNALAYTIEKISKEIDYRVLNGTDVHATTISLFNMLAIYSWDAKLVLTLTSFASFYGVPWMISQISSTNKLAESMACLKQLPDPKDSSAPMNLLFDGINNLIIIMMDVTWCVVEFRDLPTSYISQEVPALSTAMAHIPTAVYWTLRSVVVCAAQIRSINQIGDKFSISTTSEWELSTLAHKLSNILEHLRKQLDVCNEYIDEKRNVENISNAEESI